MELWRLAAAAVGVAGAGVMRGITGFGGALVMSPVLSAVYGPGPGVALVVLVELAGYLQLVRTTARHTAWRQVAPLAVAAVAVMPLGTWLVVTLDPALMQRLIGGVVMALALLLMAGRLGPRHPPLSVGLGAAGVSGVLTGMAGTPGPPVVLYLYAGPDSAAGNRATLIGYATIVYAAAVALFALNGVVGWPALARLVVLAPVALGATWLGAHLFHQADDQRLRRLALVLIFLIGLAGVALA